MYSFFETALDARESNVILRDGTRLVDVDGNRGVGPGFNLFYDTALKTFQVSRRVYFPGDVRSGDPFEFDPFDIPGEILLADSEPFTNDRIRVHSGGVGEVGPVLIDLGFIPLPRHPPTTLSNNQGFTVPESPGFRNVIKQLSNAEAELLRAAFYGDGFYVEITDNSNGQPLARAEGFLEIALFDAARRAANGEPLTKGTINFASEYGDGGEVTVISNGKIIGVLNEFIEMGGDPPDCGIVPTGQSVSAEYWPSEYYDRAFAEDGTEWEGHFQVISDSCATIVLAVE